MVGQTSAGREKAALYFQETNGDAHYTGDLVFALNNDSGSAVQVSTSDERMRITSSGKLGIGTDSPSSYYADQLVVDIGSSSQNGITIKSGPTAQGIICFADGTSGTERYSAYIDYHHNTNVLSFGTNSGNERFRLGPAGQFGIGGAFYGTSGQVLTSQGSSAAPQWATPAGGKILQVVQTVKTDTTSTNNTSYEDITGMSVSITPSSTSSKVLVMVSLIVGVDYQFFAQLMRNSTAILLGDSAGSRIRSTFGLYGGGPSIGPFYNGATPFPITYLDSPSTTSATTYKVQWKISTTGYPAYLNRSKNDGDGYNFARAASTIIAMEVSP
jgi:hypothetical protein